MSSENEERVSADQREPDDDPRIGSVVGGRWRVVRPLGRGGMGVVYEGLNVAIGKRVALKFIDADFASDHEVVTRFQREAEAASAVESAHIVEVFDTGVADDGVPYLVMEHLRGESLGARLRRAGPMQAKEAVHIVAQTLRGLGRAHEAGVIHRDLKPDNLFLVDRDDDPLFVKVLDFGISKIAKRPGDVGLGTLTRKGTVLGTPFYMSPEQAQANADLDDRGDLYSVGAILFECLTGKPPHAELTTYEAVIVAICTRDVPDVRDSQPGLPEALAGVTKKALSRDRDARFTTASEFLDALRSSVPGVVSSRGVTSVSTPRAVRPPEPSDPTALALPPQTKTSWTQRDKPGAALAVTPQDQTGGAKRLAIIGVGTALAAFAITLLVIRLGSTAPASTTVASADPPPPEVTLRIGTDVPSAIIVVDGVRTIDGVVRGPALSKHAVHIEAEGYAPIDRPLLLDGRTEVRVELSPMVAPTSSTSPPHGKDPPATHTGTGTGKKPPTTASVAPPTTAKPPPTGGGLQLKVDP